MTRLAVTIPVIETERLILRDIRESDLDHVADFFASKRSEYVGGPMDRAECWRAIASWLGHWAIRGYGLWAVHHKLDDRIIGVTGFINREGWHEPELGWHLYDGYEGQRYAFEAAMAAREAGQNQFGLDGVISYIAPDNTRSRHLAERLGARFERDDTLFDAPVQVYRHPKHAEAA